MWIVLSTEIVYTFLFSIFWLAIICMNVYFIQTPKSGRRNQKGRKLTEIAMAIQQNMN